MSDFQIAYQFLLSATKRDKKILNQEQWSEFKKSSVNKQWIYLYKFVNGMEQSIIAWGTSSNSSDRIRKASIFNAKLTGKYDRRVDYLMLKEIYGMPEVYAFETPGKATEPETQLKSIFNQGHCYRGLSGQDRSEISRIIVERFLRTPHFLSFPDDVQNSFNRFLNDVYFANRCHPNNSKRTFFWGDCLEPGFLRVIGEESLGPVIENVLRVRF